MNIDKVRLGKALAIFCVIGFSFAFLIKFTLPADAFYGSLNRDGNPVWECYDHPENCK